MYNLLANETAASLRAFFQNTLPLLAGDWWPRHVVNALTFQQQRRVEESRIESLAGLDLAALIRVLDQNWYEITNKVSMPREARNYVKEMQTIRNRWAHRSGETLPPDDMYRDLDTLQRFLEVIQADKDLIGKVREKKQACHSAAPAANQPEKAPPKATVPETEFTVGEIIVLRADPAVTGAVIQVIPGNPENRYLVFVNGNTHTYYASQLARKEVPAAARETIPLDQFHAHLTALQLQHPGTSNLYSLHAARINFIPYQFKPVLKLIRSDRPRLLIADEVGVGKTIEAGLILRELQARRDINSVLIICPKPLVTERKWQTELKRFDEHFVHLDGGTLRNCIRETDYEGGWPEPYSKCILPFSLFSEEMLHGSTDKRKGNRKGIIGLDPLPHFDLVIVDEAHHLRNGSSYLHQGVRFFCENAEAVVFLTATPVQLGSNDLFTLLNLLRPDLIIDQTSYSHMAGPNPHINSAIELARRAEAGWQEKAGEALKQAASTPWGKAILQNNPAFQRLYDQLHDLTLSPEERIAFIRDTEQFHTFSSIINRTRRRDIGNFTTRNPKTVTVDFTPEQAKLHNGLLEVQAKIFQRIHGDQNLMFMMTTIRRQAASCLYGLAPFLEDILTRRTDALQLLEVGEEWDSLDGTKISAIEGEIQKIIALAKNLPPDDPKMAALLKIAHSKETLPNNKMLLFSSFRHTLRYIHRHLKSAGFRVEIIHGDVPDEDRRQLRSRFSMPRENPETIDILLCSEVGCEGLDYQFCDCLVNYDLPWNPMRVEQRIGRIDRYGQESEKVAIYNLITPGTVDADIYERCLMRIGVFRDAIGGSEEILGRITQEIRAVAENLSLSDEERGKKLQQIADNDIRLIQEQAELERKQPELFGLRLPSQHYEQEVNHASSYWLSPWALQNLVRYYLEGTCGNDLEYILGEKELKTLRLSQEARNRLLVDFKPFSRKKSPVLRDWEKWLKGSNQHLQITFEAAMASENRDATFITPVHPLALQAAQLCADKRTTYTAFKVACGDVAPGAYPFAMYIWQKHGVREDVTFQPVCADPALGARFLELMGQSVEIEPGLGLLPEQGIFDQLDREHHRLWTAARSEHQEYNYQLVQYRKESLQTSHRARLSILHEQLEKASEAKIRIMRQSEIARAEADFMRRMEDVEKAEVQADISAQAVVFGVMVVEGEK